MCKQILHRGYPIERLSELTRRPWVAYVLTVPVFVAPHIVFFGPQRLRSAARAPGPQMLHRPGRDKAEARV